MRTPTPTLTPQELAIMKVVWKLESATVRDVYEHLRKTRDLAYTTVLTMMKILEQKGYVKKTRAEKAFVYRPAQPRAQVIGGMVREFVDRVFDGASRPMLLHLVKEARLSEKERKALLRAIEEVEE
ncbi:MAG TPA: BlaI/MecI/CopY family transcriptional regulator [Vicinamibacterales bacterium]|jgi:predicted transcriptional regulator|nr:BlaI/MecI/CopY family transcriptional regulator [Vicinamibacterales bacterium]